MDPSHFKHFMWTQSFGTDQADALLDRRRPAVFVGSAPAWLASGCGCVPATRAPLGEIRGSARARDERGSTTTAS